MSSERKDAQSDGFVLFIDEAGDPGLKAVAPVDANGSSEWFILGAVLFRRRYEVEAVEWVKSIRRDINAVQGHDLHFRKLSATKRLRACELTAKLPIRAFAVASHKVNMRGYHNPRAAKQQNADWFYNWCLRLLLERATVAVDLSNQRAGLKNTPIRVVMAERGGHSYSKTAVYIHQLRQQARHGTGVLQKRQIVPDALDWGQVEYIPASQSAGAQLADVVASAFYSALRRPIVADAAAPAKLLRPIMARENGRVADFGLALFPAPHTLELAHEFKDVFRFYGHVL